MIDYIKGELTEINPAYAVVEAGGIGYGVQITLTTYTAIQQQKSIKLYIYESIREDAHVLYGFLTPGERQLFLLLISVSGIGANTARMIMSSYSAQEIQDMIATGNVRALNSIKGIGSKMIAAVHEKYNSAARYRLEVTEDNPRAAALYRILGCEDLPYRQMIMDTPQLD